jgi:hypothetical protein
LRAIAKLLKPHHPAEVEIHEVLTELASHAIVLPAPLLLNAPAASDPGEQFLSDLTLPPKNVLLS